MKPTIGLLMGIYNEAGRIEECLNYHLKYVEEIVIVIQESNDGTEDIVANYFKERADIRGCTGKYGYKNLISAYQCTYPHIERLGEVKVTVLHFPKMGCSEATLQYGADTLKTDWVLYVDADEKFPEEFLEEMHTWCELNNNRYDAVLFDRENWFDIQVYNENVPIEPKNILARHPKNDAQLRLSRRSMSWFPPQVHMRVRVKQEDGTERIYHLPKAIYHLKTLDEQWIDNHAYDPAVRAVEEKERLKREAMEKGDTQ